MKYYTILILQMRLKQVKLLLLHYKASAQKRLVMSQNW